MATMQQYMK
jgi:hypothetical protein